MRVADQPPEELGTTVVPVAEAADVGEARRVAGALAAAAGFDEVARGRLAIVVTEAAQNLWRHAGGGRMLLRAAGAAVEVLALDRGPGIADVAGALVDGYSTAGSAGLGLGAVARLSTAFDLHSVPGAGTVLFARVPAARRPPPAAGRFAVGVVAVPAPGERQPCEAWAVEIAGERLVAVVADGREHGGGPAEVARLAVRTARAHAHLAAGEIADRVREALRGTRGADVAIAELRAGGAADVAVVGGAGARPLAPGPAVVAHTDGLDGRWTLEAYPELAGHHPAVVAGVLYRDFAGSDDDVTVVAVGVIHALTRIA